MNIDWKDALSALRDNVAPASEDENEEKIETSESKVSQKSPLTIITDKKGRNGKIATIIEGFTIPQADVEDLARKLKQKLGVGGSVREGEILIQGNHKEKVTEFLKSLNFKTKK